MKPLSKRLAIDTATKAVHLALFEDETLVSRRDRPGQNDHSVTLIPLLEEMLLEAGWELSQIDEIYVGIGPGSYTGVRIGVTIAKMLAYLNDIPLMTFSSLALLATAFKGDGIVLSAIDARRAQVFLGLYFQQQGLLARLDADRLELFEPYRSSHEDATLVWDGDVDFGVILKSGLFETADSVHDVAPNYLQATEAEKKKEASQ